MTMRRILFSFISFSLLFLWSCEQEDYSFGEILPPSNLAVEVDIQGSDTDPEGDGSGLVSFTADASNAITYKFVFSDGTEQLAPSGTTQKRFTQVGVNTYEVTVVASGRGGVATSSSLEVTVRSDFDDNEAIQLLTGGSSKTWYWAADEPAHLGVGQNDANAEQNFFPNFYQATPFEKAGSEDSDCLYEDEMTFSLSGDQLLYQLDNMGQTYFNVGYESVVGGTAGFDFCYDFEVMDEPQVVTLAPSESVVAANGIVGQTRGTVMNFSQGGFMSYYIGSSSYEILSITENRMVVRAIQGNNDFLAWYHIFTSTKP